jgi:hypothetical protein
MKAFFESPERQAALLAELESWKGTRFWREAGAKAKKGVGADCVSFVEKVLVAVGAIQPIEWPDYVVFDGGAEMATLMEQTLDAIPELVKVWPQGVADPIEITIPGDIWFRTVEIRGGESDFHHLAIYRGDNTLVQMRERGVTTANVHDRFAIRKLQAIYRAYEPEPSRKATSDRG